MHACTRTHTHTHTHTHTYTQTLASSIVNFFKVVSDFENKNEYTWTFCVPFFFFFFFFPWHHLKLFQRSHKFFSVFKPYLIKHAGCLGFFPCKLPKCMLCFSEYHKMHIDKYCSHCLPLSSTRVLDELFTLLVPSSHKCNNAEEHCRRINATRWRNATTCWCCINAIQCGRVLLWYESTTGRKNPVIA